MKENETKSKLGEYEALDLQEKESLTIFYEENMISSRIIQYIWDETKSISQECKALVLWENKMFMLFERYYTNISRIIKDEGKRNQINTKENMNLAF